MYSTDGKTIAVLYADGFIEPFDGHGDGKVETTIGEFSSYVSSLAITETLLVASDDSLRLMFI